MNGRRTGALSRLTVDCGQLCTYSMIIIPHLQVSPPNSGQSTRSRRFQRWIRIASARGFSSWRQSVVRLTANKHCCCGQIVIETLTQMLHCIGGVAALLSVGGLAVSGCLISGAAWGQPCGCRVSLCAVSGLMQSSTSAARLGVIFNVGAQYLMFDRSGFMPRSESLESCIRSH
jgi:hypothetical protein